MRTRIEFIEMLLHMTKHRSNGFKQGFAKL